MNLNLKIIIVFLLLISSKLAMAQTEGIFGIVIDDKDEFVVGAVAILSREEDKKIFTATTNNFGHFVFANLKPGNYKINVSCLGYLAVKQDIKIKDVAKDTIYNFVLKVSSESISAAKVVGEVKAVEIVGDTLRYNVASVRQVGDDEVLADVLKGLPGIEVDENGLSIMGEKVTKIYINGELIFGSDPSSSLKYLSGTQVLKVDSYKDYNDRDKYTGRKNASKDRVVNVRTKEPIKAALLSRLIAGLGTTTHKNDKYGKKYETGGAFRYFTEKNNIDVNLLFNNTGEKDVGTSISTPSATTDRNAIVSLRGEHFFKKYDNSNLSFSYYYLNNYKEDDSYSDRLYTDIGSRRSLDARQNNSIIRSHNFSFGQNLNKLGTSINGNLSISDSKNERLNSTDLFSDTYSISNERYFNLTGKKLSSDINIDKSLRIADNHYVYFNIGGIYISDNSHSLQSDSIYLKSREVSISSPKEINKNAYAMMNYSYDVSEKLSLRAELKMLENQMNRRKFVYSGSEKAENLLDLRSEDLDYKFTTYSMSLISDYRAGAYQYIFSLPFVVHSRKYDAILPVKQSMNDKYFFVTPYFTLNYSKLPLNISSSIKFSVHPPERESITPVFDDSEPMYVKRGNPSLKPEKNLSFVSNANYIGSSNSVVYIFQFDYTKDKAVSLNMFFPEKTEFEGYVFRPGTNFLTYRNSNQMSLLNNIVISKTLSKPRVIMEYNLSHNLDISESYLGTDLNKGITNILKNVFSLRTLYSRNFQQSLILNLSYRNLDNSIMKDIRSMDASVRFLSKNRFGKFNLSASYNYMFTTFFSDEIEPFQNHGLNLKLSYEIFSNGRFFFQGINLLDDRRPLKVIYGSNYVENRYNPVLGRYFSIGFLWDFNSTRHKGRFVKPDNFSNSGFGRTEVRPYRRVVR